MPSKSSLLTISLLTFSAVGVQACATVPSGPTLTVPASFRQPCPAPNPDGVQTVAQLAAFSIRQDGALAACDATRAGLVDLIDGLNAAVKPKPWWRFF